MQQQPAGAVVYESQNSQSQGSLSMRRDVVRKNAQMKVIGKILIAFGVISIVFNLIDLGLVYGLSMAEGYNEYKVLYPISDNYHSSFGFIGHGIWGGIVYILAGAFGVAAGNNRTTRKIVAFGVLCALGGICSIIQFSMGIAGAASMSHMKRAKTCQSANRFRAKEACDEMSALIAFGALMAISGLVVFICCILGLVICCRTGRRDSSLPSGFVTGYVAKYAASQSSSKY